MNEYDKQVKDFLDKTGATLTVKYLRHGVYFDGDKEPRDIYEFTIKRGNREYKGEFGQSTNDSGIKFVGRGSLVRHFNVEIPSQFLSLKLLGNQATNVKLAFMRWFKKKYFHATWRQIQFGKKPRAYDILAGMPNLSSGDTFGDFCSNFGYDTDSRKAEKIFKACEEELVGLERLFSEEELNKMREIQ